MPTPNDVLAVARAHLGEHESPDGSNHTEFGQWYGMDRVAWCAEFVSFCLAHGGFSTDGGGTVTIPGVHTSTSKGWAYVPSIVTDASVAGRFDRSPRPGDVVCFYWGGGEQNSHTGLVESVNADGSFNTIEGNEANQVERRTRPLDGMVKGFFHPPYAAAAPASTPTPTPTEDTMAEPGAAVDVVMNDDGTGWVLDRWGGISTIGDAKPVVGGPYWKGQDVARRLVITDPAVPSGYVLDCKGAVHPFGGAPAVKTPAPYWP